MRGVGSVGIGLPMDVLMATGCYAGPLAFNIDRKTPIADQWIESRFAPWVHALVEDWAAGVFDHLDAVVFSRGEDNSQRLYYYLCELRSRGLLGGPEPLIFDAAHINRPTSAARMETAVRRLAGQLDVDDRTLEAAIVTTNVQRSVPVAAQSSLPVCLLAGTPPPDDRLHQSVVTEGWRLVGDTLPQLWSALGPEVAAATGNPATAIAAQLTANSNGPRGFLDRAQRLVADALSARAQAVILWLIEEEEGLVWHVPAQKDALALAGIPTLILTRRDWAARDGVDTEIVSFIKGLAT